MTNDLIQYVYVVFIDVYVDFGKTYVCVFDFILSINQNMITNKNYFKRLK